MLVLESAIELNCSTKIPWNRQFARPLTHSLDRTGVETRSLRGMVSSGPTDIPETHLNFQDGGISKKLNTLFIPCSGIPRSRLVYSRDWLDSSFDGQKRERIRDDEANKYCGVFLNELPNGLQIAA
jgi:hypothetical protein